MINEYHIHGDNNTIIVQQALLKEELIVDNKLSSTKTKLDLQALWNLCFKFLKWVIKLAVFPLFF